MSEAQDRHGVSVLAAITGTIPAPTHTLRWGEDIPPRIMEALRSGDTAVLQDASGKPYSLILVDYFGTIREKFLDAEIEP